MTIICYLTKGKLFLGLELSTHVTVIAHTDGQKAKSRIPMAMGWVYLGATEQKDILPDFTIGERRNDVCVYSRYNGKEKTAIVLHM